MIVRMSLLKPLLLSFLSLAIAGCEWPNGSPPRMGRASPADAQAANAATPPKPMPTKPFDVGVPPGDAPAPVGCGFPALPPDVHVYAAGAYGGAKADFQIDESGHEATTIRVAVNKPSESVALLLGAYEPTVWNVGWSPRTRIVAVLVSGYHAQRVSGVPANVPVITSSYDNHGACGYAYVGDDDAGAVEALARRAFGRVPEATYVAHDGLALVGGAVAEAALVTDASARDAASFALKDAPPAGDAGLQAALQAGVLRLATDADVAAWREAHRRQLPAGASDDMRTPAVMQGRAYVVLKPFRIPAGLYGAHLAVFYVAEGVPLPTGDPGHSPIYDMNSGRCLAAICGMGR
jgi:hypothetical protein